MPPTEPTKSYAQALMGETPVDETTTPPTRSEEQKTQVQQTSGILLGLSKVGLPPSPVAAAADPPSLAAV